MKKFLIPDLHIECAYAIYGKGPNVVLIHGLCDSGKAWETHAQALAPKYRVLVPDLPGYGHSQPFTDGDFSMEHLQRAVFALADAEKMDTFTVVGHSMGGYTALAMLEAQPKRLEGISLFHSTSHGDSEEKRNGRDRSVRVLRQNRSLFFREVFKNLFNSERLELFMPIVQRMYELSADIETDTVIHTLLALRDRKDRYELLNDFHGRISYFIGRHDNVFPADTLIREAQSLGAHYHVSEPSGHMGFYEDPKATEEYLHAFLGNTTA